MKKNMPHCIIVCVLFLAFPLTASTPITRADSLFEQRNKNFDKEKILADSSTINKTIHWYRQAVNENSAEQKYEAVWKLLRAFYFKATFTTDDKEYRQRLYHRAINFGEKYVDSYPNRVELHCWLGILWGYLGEVQGLLTSARQGVAGKVKNHAEKTIDLDADYLDAGGYRMLGLLHRKVPKIPLVLTWPSEKKALSYLERAYKMAPENLFNKLYLAQALAEQDQQERARKLLQEIINTDTVKHGIAADTMIKHQSQKLLKELK